MAAEADEELAAEEAAEEEGLHPFFNATASGGTDCRVQAGWVNTEGEVESLVMDFAGGVGMAEQAFVLAYQWYINMISAMLEESFEDAT